MINKLCTSSVSSDSYNCVSEAQYLKLLVIQGVIDENTCHNKENF